MKNQSKFLSVALCLASFFLANKAKAQNWYWDINGATAGAGGATPSGNWEDPNWTSSSAGTIATFNWVENNFPRFAAGTDATGSYTVTANSDHTITGMLHQNAAGTVTISGPGVLTIGGGVQQGFFGGTGGSIRINNKLTGTGGVISSSGQIYLDGDNDYSGGTTPGAGLLNFNNAHSFGTGNLILSASGGALIVEGTSAINIANNWTVTLATVNLNCVGNTAGVTYSGNVDLGANTFNVGSGGSTANIDIFSGVISGTGNFGRQSQTTAGIIKVTGANTYSGKTTLTSGETWASSLNSVVGGTASSSFGAPTTVANGTIGIGGGTTAATLVYTGAGETSDRVINLAGTTAGATIQSSGSGALVLTSDFTATGSGAKTLTLRGANTGNNTIAGKIVNSTGGITSVTKSDSGKWILAAANTYSGVTTINAGILQFGIADAIAGSSSLRLNGGTVNPGGFNQNLSGTTLNLTASTVIDFGAGGSELDFANSSALSWAGILNLDNWDPLVDKLRIGTDSTGLTLGQLAMIEFNGVGAGTAQLDSAGYVVVPEPSTWALGVLGGLGMMWSVRRRKA